MTSAALFQILHLPDEAASVRQDRPAGLRSVAAEGAVPDAAGRRPHGCRDKWRAVAGLWVDVGVTAAITTLADCDVGAARAE